MPSLFRTIVGNVMYMGLYKVLIKNEAVRQRVRNISFSLVLFLISAAAAVLVVLWFLLAFFFFLAGLSDLVLPAIWSGVLTTLVFLMLIVWAGYYFRR